MEDGSSDLLTPTANVVAAFVANQKLSAAELSALITAVGRALGGLDAAKVETPETVKLTPAQIRKSITPNALISFEDGKGYKTLKRHLSTRGMTPAAYKTKWGLPNDYPTTAPSYSATRSAMAKSFGFGVGGRKPAGGKAAASAKSAKSAGPAKRTSGPAKTGKVGRPRKARTSS